MNTKFKVLNPNWEKIGITPVEQDVRNKLGKAVEKDDVLNINQTVEELFEKAEEYKANISGYYQNLIFNHDTAAKKGAEYILKSLAAKNKKQ